MSNRDKVYITEEEKLNNLHINFAQGLLKMKFPDLNGLQSTLLQSKKLRLRDSKRMVKVVHSRGDHWIVVSTINADDSKVNVYDLSITAWIRIQRIQYTTYSSTPSNLR